MKLRMRGRSTLPVTLSALALGALMTAAAPVPAHADAAVPGTAIAVGSVNTTTYADDGDKGKGKKAGTEPIIIGEPIIVPDPPKPPPKKKN